MRILMSTWGWQSHFYCLAPLGWALQAAGHEVRVASHPSMAQTIGSAGLAAVPLGADIDFAEAFAGRIGKVGRLHESRDEFRDRTDGALEPAITPDGGVVRLAEAMLDELVAFGRSYRPDLMVWEPFNLAAAVAAAALGVAGVLALWGPDSSVTLRMDAEAVIGPLAGRFGLDTTEVSLSGALTLDPVPPPMQVPLAGPSQPVRFVPYNGVAVVPAWLRTPGQRPQRPRVCVTTGTMMAGAGLAGRLDLPKIVSAVAELDVEVVVAAAQPAELGPLPDNVRVADAPLALHLVLSECAAIVQQGGAGTTMTALNYGVPQLILPQVSDQHFNAERLALTGAGTYLDAESADAATVRDTVGELAGGGRWRECAMLIGERMHRMPTPATVVDSLIALTTGEGART